MSDLGPAIVAVAGTAVGAGVTGFFAYQQARLNERSLDRRLAHERQLADEERRAAALAEAAAQERTALVDLGVAVRQCVANGGMVTTWIDVRRSAYQVDDRVLHELVEARKLSNPALAARVGYLLRTDPADRTPDGHVPPPGPSTPTE